jgi:ATP-dependent RNA helicase DeaD
MLLRSANITAIWQSAPTAEEIRAQDQLRLIEAVAATPDEEDLTVARALMAQRTPEEIAAAYVRLARTRMPSPEDLADVEPAYTPYAPSRDRGPRPEGRYEGRSDGRADAPAEPPRPGFEDAVWFRIDLGRNKNAEARWLLPLLCRRGHLTKRDIGAIRVFERETRFQIIAEAVERFEAAAAKGDGDGGRIHRLEDGAPTPQSARTAPFKGPRPPFKKPHAAAEHAAPAEARPPRPDRPPKPFKAKRPFKKGKPNG